MNHTIYLQRNGEILRCFSGPDEDVAHQLAVGEAVVAGNGSWLSHRVEGGVLVALPEVRKPSFDGAHWDAGQAAWFDPLLRVETAAAARADRRLVLLQLIIDQELRQARPLREIEVARALARAMPEGAISSLRAIDSAITDLRAQLAALA